MHLFCLPWPQLATCPQAGLWSLLDQPACLRPGRSVIFQCDADSDPGSARFVVKPHRPATDMQGGGNVSSTGHGDYFGTRRLKQLAQMREVAAITRESIIFSGVIVWFNGATTPPNEILRALILAGGGETRNDLTFDVTHVVAVAFADWRVTKFAHMRRPPAVILPTWVTGCMKAHRRLREIDFALAIGAPPRPLFAPIAPVPPARASGSARHAGNDPTFVSTYFEQSRLHHIGSWRNDWISLLIEHRRESLGTVAGADAGVGAGAGAGAGVEAAATNESIGAGEGAGARASVRAGAHLDHKLYSDNQEELQWPRVIAHVDIDCFFAQIALLQRPDLRNSPVAVAHGAHSRPEASMGAGVGASADASDEHEHDVDGDGNGDGYGAGDGDGNGEVGKSKRTTLTRSSAELSSCNYEARKFGVRAGMFVEAASRLCPTLVILPYDFARARAATRLLYTMLLKLAPRVQALSCDEAYVDLSQVPAPLAALRALRASFENATGCTVSVGVGSSLLASRLATARAKPNGLAVLPQDAQALAAVLAPLPVGVLHGVGPHVEVALGAVGIFTVGDGAMAPRATLEAALGPAAAAAFADATRGIDKRDVITAPPLRKSLGCDMNYGIRLSTRADAERVLRGLAEELARRVAATGEEEAAFAGRPVEPLKARSLTLKVMVRREGAGEPRKFNGHGSVNSISRSMRPSRGLTGAVDLAACANKLLGAMALDPVELRGLGMAVEFERPVANAALLLFAHISAAEAAIAAAATATAIQVVGETGGGRRTAVTGSLARRWGHRTALPPQPPAKRTRTAAAILLAVPPEGNDSGSENDVVFVEVPISAATMTSYPLTAVGLVGLRQAALRSWLARAADDGESLAADATAALLVEGSADEAVVFLRALARVMADEAWAPTRARVTSAIMTACLKKFGFSLIWE